MNLQISNHSSYPRIGEKEAHLALRRALHSFDRKRISEADLNTAYNATIQAVINEQAQNDCDVITDGLIRWNDPISHLMKKLEGVQIQGLLRLFDTNFYFREPLITGKVRRRTSLLSDEAAFLKQKATQKRAKVVLMGPYTLARLSKIEHRAYASVTDLADDLANQLAEEIRELSSLGVSIIQIDEPSYVVTPPDWRWAAKNLSTLLKHKGQTKIVLSTYFGNATPHYKELQQLPVDALGVDVTYSPKLLETIEEQGSQKELWVGLLDGRNTKLEKISEGVLTLKRLTKSLKGKTVVLTTSCGLEYLPRNRAFDKLSLLKAIKHEFNKG